MNRRVLLLAVSALTAYAVARALRSSYEVGYAWGKVDGMLGAAQARVDAALSTSPR